MTDELLVIGVGNPQRGDDAAGHAVVSQLQSMRVPGLRLRTLSGEALELIAAWQGAANVIVVDAASSGSAPGSVRQFDATNFERLARNGGSTTHGFGVAHAIALAANIDRLPAALSVFAIEGDRFEQGAPLSASVASAVEDVALRIASAQAMPSCSSSS